MARLNHSLHRALRLVGTRGARLLAVGVASALVLAVIEYALALFLMVFLCSLHFVDAAQLPAWLPVTAPGMGSLTIWIVLLAIGLLQSVCMVVNYMTKLLFTEGSHARMRMGLAYHLLLKRDARCLPLSEITQYTAEIFPKATSFLFYFCQTVTCAILALMMAIGMLFLAPGEAVVGLAGLAAMGSLVLRLNRTTNRLGSLAPVAQAELERTKVRIARNWLLIRVFRIQDREFGNWVHASYAYYRHSALAFLFGNLGGAMMPVLGIVIIASIVLTREHLFHTPVINLVGFLYLFVRFQQMVANGSNLIGGLFMHHTHLEKATALMLALSPEEWLAATRPEREFRVFSPRPAPASHFQPPPRVSRAQQRAAPLPAPSLMLDRVTFAWPGTETPILQDYSLVVQPGEQLGIVGPNGCGKSTLVEVILGALQPAAGRVLIDGQSNTAYLLGSSHAIAYVGPDPYLIQGSIRENLTYGLDASCTDADIHQALTSVGLAEFIQGLPDGLEFQLQENGDGLSTGQKQRLAMARSFLRLPALFIMDEPSANLDAATEAAVLDALRALKGRCTVILVSHQPGMLKDADRIIRMGAADHGN